MKPNAGLLVFVCTSVAFLSVFSLRTPAQKSGGTAGTALALPLWAYPVLPHAAGTPSPLPMTTTDANSVEHVPGSKASYTKKQIPDLFVVPDWFPNAHPPMPPVVAIGRKPNVYACGHCHLPNGLGRPENVSVAGLPEPYMLQQMEDFKNGLRRSSEPRMDSVNHMIIVSRAATPEEVRAGVAYFASLKPQKWIHVVETDTVPITKIGSLMLVVTDPHAIEPIGRRIIEVSEDQEQTELRNPTSGFVAYVPTGSLRRGEQLVKTGGDGRTVACTTCHGANLKGIGNVPSIAGRSPSQMTRQLIDFQRGMRNGAGAAMMKAPLAKLTSADIVAITGFLASLEP
jgi:cytochrome c553